MNKHETDTPISAKAFRKMYGIKEPKIPRKLKKAKKHFYFTKQWYRT